MKRTETTLQGYRLTVQLHDHPADDAYRPGRRAWDGRNLEVHVQIWLADNQVSTATWLEAEAIVRAAFYADAPVETDLHGARLLHYEDHLALAQDARLVTTDVLQLMATEVLRIYLQDLVSEEATQL